MRYYWTLLVVLVVFLALSFFLPVPEDLRISSVGTTISQQRVAQTQTQTVCADGEKRTCIISGFTGYNLCGGGVFSDKCYIANLDNCAIDSGYIYRACCKKKGSGIFYDCTDDKKFSPGDYVMIKTNLQRNMQLSNVRMDTYKACGFSSLTDLSSSEITEHWKPTTAFSTGGVACSSEFFMKDFHQGAVDGLVPNQTGKIKLVEWRVYPADTPLWSDEDAHAGMGSSKAIFTYEVEVGE